MEALPEYTFLKWAGLICNHANQRNNKWQTIYTGNSDVAMDGAGIVIEMATKVFSHP